MNQQTSDDKLDPQDPQRKEMQPPIATQLPDTIDVADADKVAAPPPEQGDTVLSTGIGSGAAIDEQVGGAGLGKSPGDDAAGERARDTRADDMLDGTRKG
ncbi:MAG: hypothetical protein ABWY27_03660 [Telluria sp.]